MTQDEERLIFAEMMDELQASRARLNALYEEAERLGRHAQYVSNQLLKAHVADADIKADHINAMRVERIIPLLDEVKEAKERIGQLEGRLRDRGWI